MQLKICFLTMIPASMPVFLSQAMCPFSVEAPSLGERDTLEKRQHSLVLKQDRLFDEIGLIVHYLVIYVYSFLVYEIYTYLVHPNLYGIDEQLTEYPNPNGVSFVMKLK